MSTKGEDTGHEKREGATLRKRRRKRRREEKRRERGRSPCPDISLQHHGGNGPPLKPRHHGGGAAEVEDCGSNGISTLEI